MAQTELRAAALQVDNAFPHLRVQNTYASICEFIQRTLQVLGPAWCHIGKTSGESGWVPSGFVPMTVIRTDPTGVVRDVQVVAVSHDAVYHRPTGDQFKVISNSAANSDPDPAIHGPGQIACYLIPRENYRWNNPPVAAIAPAGGGIIPPAPPVVAYPGDAFFYAVGDTLAADYVAHGQALNAGSAVWFGRVVFDIVAGGLTPAQSVAKHRPEWLQALGA